MKIYKKNEFRAFIRSIKHGQIAHWQDIARAIGVDENTITVWKKLPEAQDAINEGIDYALEQMQTVGKRDWRMWETKLKMLGVNPASKVEHTGEGLFNVDKLTIEVVKAREDNIKPETTDSV